jgi:hypothetical protein
MELQGQLNDARIITGREDASERAEMEHAAEFGSIPPRDGTLSLKSLYGFA